MWEPPALGLSLYSGGQLKAVFIKTLVRGHIIFGLNILLKGERLTVTKRRPLTHPLLNCGVVTCYPSFQIQQLL